MFKGKEKWLLHIFIIINHDVHEHEVQQAKVFIITDSESISDEQGTPCDRETHRLLIEISFTENSSNPMERTTQHYFKKEYSNDGKECILHDFCICSL